MRFRVFGKNIEIDESFVEEDKDRILSELEEFMNGEREDLDLSVRFPDSFTGEVMKEVAEIPYGETRTYGEIAGKLGSSPVAVGQACGKNPVPLVVPCHRVVGENSIGGYQYAGVKEKLLDLELRN